MNILLVGFFGEGNLGDNAILASILSNIHSKHKIYITSGNQPSVARGLKIRRRGISSWLTFVSTVKDCKHTILSGGILQDWSFDGILFFALRIIAANMLESKVSLWGAGLGPANRKGSIPLIKKSLRRLNCAWLRDKESKLFFEKVSQKQAKLGTDWSWGINVASLHNNNKRLTGINLREWRYFDFIKVVKKDLTSSHNNELIGLAARKNDVRAIKSLTNEIRVIIPDDFTNLLSVCHGLQKGIAMRYHVALAMLRAGVATKLVPYDTKVKSLACDANVDIISDCKSNFKVASDKFIEDNKNRFNLMQSNFLSYLESA